MALLDQKWIALDRGHYLCEGDVTIAVQDATAGASPRGLVARRETRRVSCRAYPKRPVM